MRGYVDGKMASKPTKPKNMFDACKNLEAADQARFPRSVRVHIPRVLVSLYEIRNNRGVGHVGGDVNPNHMDATLVMESAKWILAELIRVFHDINTQEATEIVDALIDRTIPVIWEVGEVRRVLKTGLPMKLQTLLLLYSIPGSVPERDLFKWVEHSNLTVYRRDVLQPAHRERLLEFNQLSSHVQISPTGIAYVEENVSLIA